MISEKNYFWCLLHFMLSCFCNSHSFVAKLVLQFHSNADDDAADDNDDNDKEGNDDDEDDKEGGGGRFICPGEKRQRQVDLEKSGQEVHPGRANDDHRHHIDLDSDGDNEKSIELEREAWHA